MQEIASGGLHVLKYQHRHHLRKKNYKTTASLALNTSRIRCVICVFDSSVRPSLLWEDFTTLDWLPLISLCNSSTLKHTACTRLKVVSTVVLHVATWESRIRVMLGIIRELVVPVFLWRMFIDKFIESNLSSEGKIVSFSSPPVSIFMEHEIDTDKTGWQQDGMVANILAERDFNYNLVGGAHSVTLNSLSRTFILIARNAKGTLKLDDFAQFKEGHRTKLYIPWYTRTSEGLSMS